MLKIFSAIKHRCPTFLFACAVVFPLQSAETAFAQMTRLAVAQVGAPVELTFLASARLMSPDRIHEAATTEMRVNLDGTRSVVLKGRTLNVTLEAEPSGFSKAQLVRVSASGNAGQRGSAAAAFSAGTFKISEAREHSFLFVDKSKGWLLEVRLRPIPRPQSPLPVRPKSPARDWNARTSKRLPALTT